MHASAKPAVHNPASQDTKHNWVWEQNPSQRDDETKLIFDFYLNLSMRWDPGMMPRCSEPCIHNNAAAPGRHLVQPRHHHHHHQQQQCTVKHHTDIINFACMTWNFVGISANLSALCTIINQICHWHCISCKILPHFDVRPISVAPKL